MTNNFTAMLKARLNNTGVALITVIAVFAVCSVLAVSITSVVLQSNTREQTRAMKEQAYLTAKSVLAVTKSHIEQNAGNRAELHGLAGKTARGELEGMGAYTVTVAWSGKNEITIMARGEFMGQGSELYTTVDVSGGA